MSPLTRRALSLVGSAALVVTLVGCSDDSSDDTGPMPTASEESDEPTDDADADEDTEEPTEDSEDAGTDADDSADTETISESDLAEQVASFMDGETGTEFPVECDGDLETVVDAEQRCWRLIDGLESEGIPDGSRLGITVTITEVTNEGPSFYVQADDAVSPPEE